MVRGSTQLVAILGTPIAQVKSPDNFNRWFADNDRDIAMLPIDLGAAALPAFVDTLRAWQNLRGCVVTVPYKQAVAPLLDALTERAAALGMANVIRREADGRLVGDHLDGIGFLKAAAAHGFQPQGKRALVVGAGGVGAAIAYALAEQGLAELVLVDVRTTQVEALKKVLLNAFPTLAIQSAYSELGSFDLVVNATPVGMGDTGHLPLPDTALASLRPSTLVADVVTSPPVTPLLAKARDLGCRIQTGPEMARAQMGNLGAFMGVTPEDA
ncbi:shikimate dehydrogenase family protein [Pseudomonas eucalypticola]|uniref:Shikimate dehydrogenase n=1 Tax=Pseudomonas eucalypticola TaxID=2599595 RepID=A0A7D5D9C4_9PSED|nr:shikimate dehydrogenase [Pseudomonas eucalypticola]QKZ06874.1 shikimate dehydrogenase [Pseudomonas eucalypticola]